MKKKKIKKSVKKIKRKSVSIPKKVEKLIITIEEIKSNKSEEKMENKEPQIETKKGFMTPLKMFGSLLALVVLISVSIVVIGYKTTKKVDKVVAKVEMKFPIEMFGEVHPSPYDVCKGDNLWDLSKKFYGENVDWAVIFFQNINLIMFPDLIFISDKIYIPAPEVILKTTNKNEILGLMYFDLYRRYKNCGSKWEKQKEGMMYMSRKLNPSNFNNMLTNEEVKNDWNKIVNGK